jgi:4-amino-4-deoxy-L-arabinose transferase-like glycosyltransferase
MGVLPERHPGALPTPGTILALALLVAAASIRFFRLGADGLWVDEAWTGLLVRVSPGQLLNVLRNDDAPPLFYLLQTLTTAVAGTTEWGLRLLPALAGTAAVVAAWRLARNRAPRAAVPTAAALGFSTVAVHYAQQARSYALLHLLAVLALGTALSLRERPGKGTGARFLVACLGLAYSHNLGILIVAAALATGVVPLLATQPHRRAGMAALGLLALGLSPWIAALLPQLGTHDTANSWMTAWWTGRGGLLLGPVYTLAALANGAGAALRLQVPLPAFPSSLAALRWAAWALGVLGLAGAANAAFEYRRARGGPAAPDHPVASPRGDTRHGLLVGAALFTAIPLLGLVVISLLTGPAYVVGRTDTLALPGLALLLGIGWTHGLPCLRRGASPGGGRLLAPIATAAWIALGAAALAPSWRGEGRTTKGSDRALAALLSAEIRPDDAVVFAALSRPTLEYYGRRLGWWDRAGWKGTFPTSFDRNAAGSWPAPLDSAAVWQQQAIALRAEWERCGTGTVWLLALRDPDAIDRAVGSDRPAAGAPQRGTPRSGGTAPYGEPPGAWPSRPAPPPSMRSQRGAASLGYPGNVLVSVLAGLSPAEVAWEYRQDWVSGDRVVMRLPRSSWVPLDSIPRLETRP